MLAPISAVLENYVMHELYHDPFDDTYEIDFECEILEALKNSELVKVTESGQHPQAAIDELLRHGEIADERGDSLIQGRDTSMQPEAEVYTHSAHSYPVLCRQAFEIVFPYASSEKVDEAARAVVEHEMEHASAAMMIGKEPFYGVRIMKTINPGGNWSYAITGFIAFEPNQKMTKADFAFIAAVTNDPAKRDLAVIQSLGYSSPEEAIETHPYFRS